MSPSMTSKAIFFKKIHQAKFWKDVKAKLQKEGIMKRQNYGVTEG
jgi:hypothetical protein